MIATHCPFQYAYFQSIRTGFIALHNGWQLIRIASEDQAWSALHGNQRSRKHRLRGFVNDHPIERLTLQVVVRTARERCTDYLTRSYDAFREVSLHGVGFGLQRSGLAPCRIALSALRCTKISVERVDLFPHLLGALSHVLDLLEFRILFHVGIQSVFHHIGIQPNRMANANGRCLLTNASFHEQIHGSIA